ncbi:MAG: acetylglutamate kinase [Gaiellaceae bacterium]
MRKLWEDHITYTRNVIISFELNEPNPSAVLPDLTTVVNRLLQNQVDIGNAVKPFYGEAAGDQLTALLKEHITGAANVLTALKTNNQPALQTALAAWYANAHQIAIFLSNANPKEWPLAEMDQMMKDHLDATTAEAVARHDANWSADVAAYDQVHAQILEMADMLSSGIIAQFPARFHP